MKAGKVKHPDRRSSSSRGGGSASATGSAGSSADLALELRGITKRFGTFTANDAIDLDLRKGEVHALLGENGAGKSTLMNVLYGLYRHDEGEIFVDGRPAHITSSADAIRLGIGMVHQHFMLIPVMTVVENIVLGAEPQRRGQLDFDVARASACARSRPSTASPSIPTRSSRRSASGSSSASRSSRRSTVMRAC